MASPDERKQKRQQYQQRINDHANGVAMKVLSPGEQLLDFIHGTHTGGVRSFLWMFATNRGVTYYEKRLMPKAQSMPYSSVTGININRNLATKECHLELRGGREVSIGRVLEAMESVEHFVETVRDQMAAEISGGKDKIPAAPSAVTTVDRLRALEELKSKGLVTDAEFEAKRKSIIEDL